jgi:FkbH-like protein
VWDLDNTLWDGVLIEDGREGIRVRPEVATIIRELDQRGILHSVASKNNHDDAMAVLEAAGLSDYFLYPQIGWTPKSASVARIASLLNIGVDAMAFVDDQVFEREEVRAGVPTVAVVDPAECHGMLDRWECQVPVTRESRRRRVMYQEEAHRAAVEHAYTGDYSAFLRECRLEVRICALDEVNLQRVYEVAQRTNQMNFSGNRYPEARLREMMGDPDLETYVIDCEDRFGAYGIIGFAVADRREPRLLDLMFSCRVQGKRVEHAVLAFLLKRFVDGEGRDFWADFRRTAQNAAAGRVFEEMGFDAAGERDGALSLVFRRGHEVLDEGIVAIRADLSTALGAGR